jgi:hypothetical protein
MGTRDDARLTAQERVALAGLESAAVADDPQLAARLKGSNAIWIRSVLLRPSVFLVGKWRWLLHHGWWGVPIVVAGLVIVVVSMSTGFAWGVAGALTAAVGLRLVAEAVEDHWMSASGSGRART